MCTKQWNTKKIGINSSYQGSITRNKLLTKYCRSATHALDVSMCLPPRQFNFTTRHPINNGELELIDISIDRSNCEEYMLCETNENEIDRQTASVISMRLKPFICILNASIILMITKCNGVRFSEISKLPIVSWTPIESILNYWFWSGYLCILAQYSCYFRRK